ncbi:MAG: hypothetical protein COB15_03260 [Flavobacteriales bacterium]|nr:MAG: hypothetical protein COB15_03260 [Flavobacteriales bacterium]
MKLYFSFIFLVIIGVCSCKSNKHILTEGDSLQVKDIYIQKIVPGLKEMKKKEFLFINFKPYDTETYLIDSIYYSNKVYYIDKNQLNYKIDLNTGIDSENNEHANSSNSIGTVFYHQKTNSYYKILKGIYRKETLYMP